MRSLCGLVLLAALGACATTVQVDRPAEQCSSILPDDWTTKPAGGPLTGTVPHDDFPGAAADTGQWIAHAQAEGDQLDISNGRLGAAVTIVQRCEQHDAELVKSLTKRPWWQVW